MVMGMAITIMPSYSGKPGHITIMLLAAALLPGMQGGGGVTVRRGGGGAGTVYNRPPAIVTSLQNFPKNTNRSCAGGGGGGQDTGAWEAGAGAERASAGANIGLNGDELCRIGPSPSQQPGQHGTPHANKMHWIWIPDRAVISNSGQASASASSLYSLFLCMEPLP